jgi:hypothetical protein
MRGHRPSTPAVIGRDVRRRHGLLTLLDARLKVRIT